MSLHFGLAQSRAARLGNRTEDLVAIMTERAEAAGAYLVKVPTAMLPLGAARGYAPGTVIARHVKAATVDILGWDNDGRPVAAEIKRVTGPRLDLSRVKPQQRAALSHCRRRGGRALVLVVTRPASVDTVHAVPWDVIAAREAAGGRGAKSLRVAELAPYAVRPGGHYLEART